MLFFLNKFRGSRTHNNFVPKETKLLMRTISKDSHVSEVSGIVNEVTKTISS